MAPEPSIPSKTDAADTAALCNAVEVVTLCAVFVIDATGRIVAANRSARELCGRAERALVGSVFAALLQSDAAAVPGDNSDAQWKTLQTRALDLWSPVLLSTPNGAARPARLRLEKTHGGAGSYIATILPMRS